MKVVGILKLIDDEENARIWLCQSAEMDFQCLVRPRNVTVDLKYDGSVLVMVCVAYTCLSLEK